MGQENSGADQTHYCRHCLNHCQRSFAPCATENGGHLAQSKRFPGANTQSRSTEDFAQQTWIFCDPVAGAAVIGAPKHAYFLQELRLEREWRREHRLDTPLITVADVEMRIAAALCEERARVIPVIRQAPCLAGTPTPTARGARLFCCRSSRSLRWPRPTSEWHLLHVNCVSPS